MLMLIITIMILIKTNTTNTNTNTNHNKLALPRLDSLLSQRGSGMEHEAGPSA